MNPTIIAGVGMVAFGKPGASDNYDVMGETAIREALADSGLDSPILNKHTLVMFMATAHAGKRLFTKSV